MMSSGWPRRLGDDWHLSRKHSPDSLCALALVVLAWHAGVVAAVPTGASPSSVHLDEHATRPERKLLQGGWNLWDPYQYREYRHGVQMLTGFDVEIERAVARAMGLDLMLTDMSWDRHLAALAAGNADIAAGATYSPERDRYA
jgi:polar amino acid transport system substrate-binding protein